MPAPARALPGTGVATGALGEVWRALAVGAAAACARGLHSWRRMATKANSMDIAAKIFLVIAIVGAVNWGLIGFFNFNLVDAIFGGGAREETSGISRVIYALVGVAGLIAVLMLPKLKAVAPHRLSDRPYGV